MIYVGIDSTFTPVITGRADCKKCGEETEQVLLVADKKAKLEIIITVAKWQSCYLVCVPCSRRTKPRACSKKNWGRLLRKHISKEHAAEFIHRANRLARANSLATTRG